MLPDTFDPLERCHASKNSFGDIFTMHGTPWEPVALCLKSLWNDFHGDLDSFGPLITVLKRRLPLEQFSQGTGESNFKVRETHQEQFSWYQRRLLRSNYHGA